LIFGLIHGVASLGSLSFGRNGASYAPIRVSRQTSDAEPFSGAVAYGSGRAIRRRRTLSRYAM